MDIKPYKAYAIKKRVVYFLGFLFIAVPIVVGVLVWRLMPKCDEVKNINTSGGSSGNAGDKTTVIPHTVSPTPSLTEPWKNLRLSRDVLPVHYDITLYPDFYGEHSWFYGNETVEIVVHKSTKFILIHYYFLNITKTTLKDSNKNEIRIKPTRGYDENQFWIIETEAPLQAGSTVYLELQFDGSLSRAIVGFYKSSYVNSITNQTRHLATSKFEPVSARRAFPCFDEPNIKANYTVHLVHKEEYTALSNMPVKATTNWIEDNALKITEFETSVKMSTYLVCFIVCDFKYLSNTTKHGVEVRTYATPDRVQLTQFALDIAVHTLEHYQSLFQVPYPLPKLDMIGIPDFVSGAMEHWGLITYREENMLYDEREASSANLQRVATVIAHEIAHQWFGNIVTMDWWDDLWLNEGFASFMEYLGVDSFRPSWKMLQQFATEDALPVMLTDSHVSSHPIIVNVENPNQINEVFDSISYSKGASVIRMLQSIMGSDAFFAGIESYLNTYKWSNAKTADLWGMLGQIKNGLSVKDVMDTWTRQMGFPYINITVAQSGATTTIKATQKRFLADISTKDDTTSPYSYKWDVYLNYITNDGTSGSEWMNEDEEKQFSVSSDLSNGWIKFNVNQTGFYRVMYPIHMLQSFSEQLQRDTSILSDVDKAGLIDDAFNLARGGYLPYDVVLNLTLFLDNEMNHLPWDSTHSVLKYIMDMFEAGGDFASLRNYIVTKVKPILDRIGWEDVGDHLQKLMRSNIIELACRMGDQQCLGNATEKFRNWIQHGQSIAPNLRSLVYHYGMQSSDSVQAWDLMWEKYQRATVPQEKSKLLFGLTKCRTVWLLTRLLQYSKDESKVRSQDFFTLLTYVSRNPIGNGLVWDWIRANWDYLVGRFTTFSRSLGRLIPSVVGNYNTEFQLQEVESFFAKYPDAGAGARGREQALETIRGNIAWMKNYQMTISRWICNQLSSCS